MNTIYIHIHIHILNSLFSFLIKHCEIGAFNEIRSHPTPHVPHLLMKKAEILIILLCPDDLFFVFYFLKTIMHIHIYILLEIVKVSSFWPKTMHRSFSSHIRNYKLLVYFQQKTRRMSILLC